MRLYPVETHIAEKLHAYTLPRDRPNSRMKDLPDLALLATVRNIEAAQLRAALEQTFAFRTTHALPPVLPDPPVVWKGPYEAMARLHELHWPTLDAVTAAARAFLDPVLARRPVTTWSPGPGLWS